MENNIDLMGGNVDLKTLDSSVNFRRVVQTLKEYLELWENDFKMSSSRREAYETVHRTLWNIIEDEYVKAGINDAELTEIG